MSGHNKWAQIKRQKASTDAKKSKMYSKLARMITTETKKANGMRDVAGVRTIIEKAKAANMPLDTIERAIKKGQGTDAGQMEALTYESYGPGGCALMIDVLTENRNKAAQEVKFILSEHGFALADPGSASWAFVRTHGSWVPNTTLPLSDTDGELLLALVDALEENDEVQEVFTNAA